MYILALQNTNDETNRTSTARDLLPPTPTIRQNYQPGAAYQQICSISSNILPQTEIGTGEPPSFCVGRLRISTIIHAHQSRKAKIRALGADLRSDKGSLMPVTAPVVSVVLPVYNAEQYIAAAVQSVLDQTFKDFEFIIIDDGSTDRSTEILQVLARKDPRIKLISRPNTGYVIALNEALAMARGEFIARMDADDICLPTRFEKQVAYLRANPDVVLLGTHVAQMDVAGLVIGPMPDVAFGHEAINEALLRRGWPIVHPAVMMRTDAVRKVGGYVVEYCPNEDHDLFLKLGEVGQLENLPEVLVHYRKHDASQSAQKMEQTITIVSRIIIEACRRRGISVPPEAAQPDRKPPAKKVDVQRSWAWNAMKHQNIATARKYALATLWRRPLSLDSWRLTYCAVRGR
jgi:glycosyltransferase involved in cell wall biosynthesis